MTLRQTQILEALLAVEESRPGGNVGLGARAVEVRRELRAIRPSPTSENMIRRELRELNVYARERKVVGSAGGLFYTLTETGRVKARELADARAAMRRSRRHAAGLESGR